MSIDVSDAAIRIESVEVPRREVAVYFEGLPPEDREEELVRAVEVGVFCLERARTSQDLDFVRRQVEALLRAVETGVGSIPTTIRDSVLEKLGTEDGKALAPVRMAVEAATTATTQRIQDVKTLLTEEIDPRQEGSTLARALRQLRDLLDDERTDSIQGALRTAVSSVTGEDGQLSKSVKAVVATTMQPFEQRLQALERVLIASEAAEDAVAQTTLKGAPYEGEVLAVLQTWASRLGIEVEHVGHDNQPGDVQVTSSERSLGGVELTIVVEARDRSTAKGRQAISADLVQAMEHRDAKAAVYVSRSRDGFAQEIGDWCEGTCSRGPFVACVHEHLTVAVRFLLAQERLARLRMESPSINATSIEGQIGRIRTSLGKIAMINRRSREIREGADSVQQEAERLRDEIKESLTDIESVLAASRVSDAPGSTAGASPPSAETA